MSKINWIPILNPDKQNQKHPKCKMIQCNHPLDPPEWDCGYNTTIDCDECKYGVMGGRKDPNSKCNQYDK